MDEIVPIKKLLPKAPPSKSVLSSPLKSPLSEPEIILKQNVGVPPPSDSSPKLSPKPSPELGPEKAAAALPVKPALDKSRSSTIEDQPDQSKQHVVVKETITERTITKRTFTDKASPIQEISSKLMTRESPRENHKPTQTPQTSATSKLAPMEPKTDIPALREVPAPPEQARPIEITLSQLLANTGLVDRKTTYDVTAHVSRHRGDDSTSTQMISVMNFHLCP